MEIVAPVGGKAPAIAAKGPTTAPKVGATPAAVPKPTIVATAAKAASAKTTPSPKAATPKTTAAPKTAAGKVAASKAVAASTSASELGETPLVSANPNQISQLASEAAAKIYNPIMQNYNAQLTQASGLAQKQAADVTAFNTWYAGQQQALAADAQTRQTNLNALLGQLGSTSPTATPANGLTSSDGTNMSSPTGGAASLAASGSSALQTGVLSTQALANASEANSSQNELTALGGAYQQNDMAAISSDLLKSQDTIEDAQSKAYDEEGDSASKIDTNMTSYLNDQNKNIITSNYDQQQSKTKAANEILAAANASGWTPSLRAQFAALTGATPTGTTVKQQANEINQYNAVTKRLEEMTTASNDQEKNKIDQIKNYIESSRTGAENKLSSAEISYYAARTNETFSEAQADLIKARAYAKKYDVSSSGGTTPLTTDESNTLLGKVGAYQTALSEKLAGQTVKDLPGGVIRTPKQARSWITANYGSGGSPESAAMWAAFDMHYYGGLTKATYQMLSNLGLSKSQLSGYKVVNPKQGK